MPFKVQKNANTKLAAALAFPCSLFLKSQLPAEPPLEDSEGTVINLSCMRDSENSENSLDLTDENSSPQVNSEIQKLHWTLQMKTIQPPT